MPRPRKNKRTNSRRRSLRFPVELPTLLRWKDGDGIQTLQTQTKNMSSSGLYLMVGSEQEPAARIEFEVRLPADFAEGALLRGKGRLVRREEFADKRVGIAASIDHYNFLPASALDEETSR